MNKDEALQIALEALTDFDYDKRIKAIEIIKEALETKDKPVAWEQFHEHMAGPNYVAPQSTWVGLTDEDKLILVEEARKVPTEIFCPDYNERLLRLTEETLKEKNHGN